MPFHCNAHARIKIHQTMSLWFRNNTQYAFGSYNLASTGYSRICTPAPPGQKKIYAHLIFFEITKR